MPDLTQNEIAMLAKSVRPDGKLPKNSNPVPKTSAAIDALVTAPATPKPPQAPRDHFIGKPVDRPGFVDLAKRFFPVESAEFTDQEIGDYAQWYQDGTVAHQLRMVGLQMRDRLDKRAAGTPWHDDSKGLAEARE